MSPESALSYLIAIFIFSITPGPGVFALLSRGLIHGYRSCFSVVAGMICVGLAYLITASVGLATLATHWNGVFTLVRILGVIYLLYLGYKMWVTPINLQATDTKVSPSKGFFQGLLISSSNPKVILFYVAFLPTFINLETLTASDLVLVASLTATGLFLGLMSIAVFAAKARTWFQSEPAMRRLNRTASGLMVGAAAVIATRN